MFILRRKNAAPESRSAWSARIEIARYAASSATTVSRSAWSARIEILRFYKSGSPAYVALRLERAD